MLARDSGIKPDYFSDWPFKKRFALLLTHDVDSQAGYDQVHRLLKLDRERGFVSSFNFVPESRYLITNETLQAVRQMGFEIGVHGLNHDGKGYLSKRSFAKRFPKINNYLKSWDSVGFYAPSLNSNLDWYHKLNVEYDSSTSDIDFEPHLVGARTVFPFVVCDSQLKKMYIEIPITLAQDFTLFILMRNTDISAWKKKTEWIIERGGLVHLRTHPDYMNFDNRHIGEQYPVSLYSDYLDFIEKHYAGQYWNVVPRELSSFWKEVFDKR